MIVIWSLQIIGPFLEIALWAIILTVAIYPLFKGLATRLGGRGNLAAVLISSGRDWHHTRRLGHPGGHRFARRGNS